MGSSSETGRASDQRLDRRTAKGHFGNRGADWNRDCQEKVDQVRDDESLKRGNGLIGIHIHNCPLFDGSCDAKGISPFDNLLITKDGVKKKLSEIYKTYDWRHYQPMFLHLSQISRLGGYVRPR